MKIMRRVFGTNAQITLIDLAGTLGGKQSHGETASYDSPTFSTILYLMPAFVRLAFFFQHKARDWTLNYSGAVCAKIRPILLKRFKPIAFYHQIMHLAFHEYGAGFRPLLFLRKDLRHPVLNVSTRALGLEAGPVASV